MQALWTSAFPAAIFPSVMPAAHGNGEAEALVIAGTLAEGAVGATVNKTMARARGRLVSLSLFPRFSGLSG